MDRESIDKLRFDKRLAKRHRWVSDEDLERELDGLPDVVEKILPPDAQDSPAGEQEDRVESAASEPAQAPAESPAVPETES